MSIDSRDDSTFHLSGRVVFVTGGAGGFGRLMCEMAAARGALVALTDVDGSAALSAAEELSAGGGEVIGLGLDVRDPSAFNAAVATTVERFGSLDVLINNAGTMPLAFFSDHAIAADAWERCIDINFKGTLNGICAVHDVMTEAGRGHVVNISSIYGNAGTAGSGVYSATKAAVRVLSDSLRVESQGRIKVTVVRPTGVLNTGLASTVINPMAAVGITGANQDRYTDAVMQYLTGSVEGPGADEDDPQFWAIQPETIAAEVIHAIDQPWGVVISDVTVRATGEMFVI